MRRAYKTILASLLLFAAPALSAAPASAQAALSEAYNGKTDRNFRIGLQMRLAWAGDYAGSFSGDIDPASLRAIRDFQARHGMKADGVIDEAFLRSLITESDGAEAASGFSMVDDTATGVRIGLPLTLVSDAGATDTGRVWRSADGGIEMETVRIAGPGTTMRGLYDLLSVPTAARSVTFQDFGGDAFTVSGIESGQRYIMRFAGHDGDIRGFAASYDDRSAARMAPVVTLAVNLFDPFADPAGSAMIVAGGHLDAGRLGQNSVALAGGSRPAAGRNAAVHSLFGTRAETGAGFEAGRDAPGAIQDPSSSGSGFVVSKDGWLLTNAHVARACETILVGDHGPADGLILDETNDLALVHVTGRVGAPLAIASGMPRLGEDILAFGYPLRSILADSLNVTRGNVSSLMGLMNDKRYLQISAPIQPGNSGGPLVDLAGHVVGVVTAKLNAVAIADATGDIPQSINFAIRPDAAARFMEAHGVDYVAADAGKASASVADTTAAVQASILPVFCLNGA